MAKDGNKTQFNIILNKELIEYYYLSNLALEGKKHWVRKEYNQEFLSQSELLDESEWLALNNLQKIILLLEESNINLLDFFCFPKPCVELQKQIPSNEFDNLKSAFNIFQARFSKFWDISLQQETEKAIENLEKLLKDNTNYINSALNDFRVFFGTEEKSKNPTVFIIILPSSVKSGGGKYLPNGKGVIIEGNADRLGSMRTLEIILHEYIHSSFETPVFFELLEKSQKKLKGNEVELLCEFYNVPSVIFALKELIANAAIITSIKNGRDNFSKLLYSSIASLKKRIDVYVETKRMIDLDFANYTLNLLIENKKE